MLKFFKKVLIDSYENDNNEYINVKHLSKPQSDYLEKKRQEAIDYLGDKWILKNKVQRKTSDYTSQL